MSEDVDIALACDLNDRTSALYNGTVQPEGIDLTFLPLQIEETFWRMLKHQEFDAAEMSMSSYMMTCDREDPELIAIPVFPSRFFRHSCIFVNAEAGIDKPEDLRGCNVGVPEYQMTAALWCRGVLQHQYGVSPEEMQWYHGGEEDAGREEKLSLDLPNSVQLEYIPSERTLSGMLGDGDLDALISARTPSSFGSESVERLFNNSRDVEMNYYSDTGHFPIMHTVVLRQDVYDERPWVAQELYKCFNEAKQLCLEELHDTGELQRALPWLIDEVEQTRDLMGWDFWPYGVDDNRDTLEFMTQMAHEQGLTDRKLSVEEIFAPTTFDEYKV